MDDSSTIGGGIIALIIVGAVLYLAILVATIWAYVNIIRRAGYSGAWILIGLVPIANFVMLLVFGFKEWPVTKELNWYRAQARGGGYGQSGYPPANY